MSRANQSFLRTDWSQIERVFYMTAPAPCPYLPHRTERKLITALDFGDDESFDQLSWSGFRRSHEIAYRPACPSCNACKSARIDVARTIAIPRKDSGAAAGPAFIQHKR